MDMTIDQIKTMLRAAPDTSTASVEDRRAAMVAGTEAMRPSEHVSIAAVTLGGVHGLTLMPTDIKPGRALLYFHGGGYVIGSPDTHKGMVSMLAEALQAPAWSMDYRKGPEAVFPAAVDDGVAAYRALLDEFDPSEILISGDSAGGGLTLAVAMKARDQGLPLPAGLIPLSPWVNLNQIGASYDTKSEADPMVSRDALNWFAETYLGPEGDADDPYASPLYGDFAGLPPMLIQVGADEVLLSDSLALAERAGTNGVHVTLEIWPDMIHVFQAFYPFLPDARRAIARIHEWASKQLE